MYLIFVTKPWPVLPPHENKHDAFSVVYSEVLELQVRHLDFLAPAGVLDPVLQVICLNGGVALVEANDDVAGLDEEDLLKVRENETDLAGLGVEVGEDKPLTDVFISEGKVTHSVSALLKVIWVDSLKQPVIRPIVVVVKHVVEFVVAARVEDVFTVSLGLIPHRVNLSAVALNELDPEIVKARGRTDLRPNLHFNHEFLLNVLLEQASVLRVDCDARVRVDGGVHKPLVPAPDNIEEIVWKSQKVGV